MADDHPATAAVAGDDEVKPYKIHVSGKYLELTRQKLELTRLPHENAIPRSESWWEPKPAVEPLIDHWLERFSWRDREARLNDLPQFRAVVRARRLHFLHFPSSRSAAVPLLLVPPFPFTNLSFAHLGKLLAEPEKSDAIAFHVVIPSLPGVGFSDALPNNTASVPESVDMLDALMRRLGYTRYLASGAGSTVASPAHIDWLILDRLAVARSGSCLGVHLINPPLAAPTIAEAPVDFFKWRIAKFLGASIFGYTREDFEALSASGAGRNGTKRSRTARDGRTVTGEYRLDAIGLHEPNTLAYALCDSPTGLLVFVLMMLHLMAGPARGDGKGRTSTLPHFTADEVLTLVNLAWLPGAEYALRFWAQVAADGEAEAQEVRRAKANVLAKPRVAITVFRGGDGEREPSKFQTGGDAEAIGATEEERESQREVDTESVELPELPAQFRGAPEPYVCPAWGWIRYQVVSSQRVPGRPGLFAWERPDIVISGIRGLAREIIKIDHQLSPSSSTKPIIAPLESVLVDRTQPPVDIESATAKGSEQRVDKGMGNVKDIGPAHQSPQSPETARLSSSGSNPRGAVLLARIPEVEDDELLKPPLAPRDIFSSDDESPDTLVLTTPPLGGTPPVASPNPLASTLPTSSLASSP